MVKRSLVILSVAFLLVYALVQQLEPTSIREIEIEFFSDSLSDRVAASYLEQVARHFGSQDIADTTKARIDRGLASQAFLTKRDSALVDMVLSIKNEPSLSRDAKFLKNNQLRLNSLFFKLLNSDVQLRCYAAEAVDSTQVNLSVARWIAWQFDKHLDYNFTMSELKFYRNLDPRFLQDKLRIEHYHNVAYRLSRSDPRGSLPYLGAALRLAKSLGDQRREVSLLTTLQYVLQRSFGLTNIALRLGTALADRSKELGFSYALPRIYFNNGHVLGDRGLFEEAIAQYELAKGVSSKIGYTSFLPIIWERIAVTRTQMGQHDAALHAYDEMNKLTKSGHDPSDRIRYQIGVGLVKFEMGRYPEAESWFTKSLVTARRLADSGNEITALSNLGHLYLEIGDAPRALEFYQEALTNALRGGDPQSIARQQINQSRALFLNRRLEEARNLAAQTATYLSQFDYEHLNARHYQSAGLMQLQLEEYEAALHSFQTSLRIFEQNQSAAYEIETLTLIGETYIALHRYERAIEILEKAQALERSFSTSMYRLAIWHGLAKAYWRTNQVSRAEGYLAKCTSSVYETAMNLNLNEQRFNFAQKVQPVFENMVLLQLERGNDTRAIFYSERMRALVFRILLQQKNRPKPADDLFAEMGPGRTRMNRDSSRLVERLQATLPGNAVVIEYELTENSVVAWVIGQNTFEAILIKTPRDQLELQISQFRECVNPDALRTDAELNASFSETTVLGRAFYQHLIAPLETYIFAADLVYFIPDEALHYLPFGAILTPEGEYLIEKVAIAYGPSATILGDQLEIASHESEREVKPKTLLAIAPDQELESAGQEIANVMGLIEQSTSLAGDQATEREVRTKLSDALYNVLLFSNHAKINNRKPYYSALVLDQPDSSSGPSDNDGHLMLNEIQDLCLHATDLAFLSACETSSGKLYKGEGIVGMQRAFLVAGAKTVIANLWRVEDKSAERLVVDFFKSWLLDNVDKATALRQAQIKMVNRLKDYPIYNNQPHPYFWASLTLAGAYN